MNNLITIKGSITDLSLLKKYNTQFIGHCANCFCTMGSGVAAAIRKDMFYAVEADNKTVSGDIEKVGKLSIGIPTAKGYPFVYNLYGQYSMGAHKRQVNYEWLYNALVGMESHIMSELTNQNYWSLLEDDLVKPVTIGFPYKMGSGLAGGSWNIVQELIREAFKHDCWNNSVLIYNIENK